MKALRKHLSITLRLHLSIFSVILVTAVLTGLFCLHQAISMKNTDRDTLISDLSRVLAQLPAVERLAQGEALSPALKGTLDDLSSMSQIDLIVICNTKSIRLYHTDNARMGDVFIGDDEGRILSEGKPYISIAVGSLGLQRRAFHAIRDAGGQINGFVMVSVLNSRINQVQATIINSFLLILLFMLFIGTIIAAIFRHTLEVVFLGYRPEEFANLYVERTEVLDALDEGIFAIDRAGKVILMNHSAKRMLDLSPDVSTEGHLLTEYYPETRLPDTALTGIAEHNISFMIRGRHIISSRIPIRRKGKIIGAVSIFRNRTEAVRLAEELTGAQYMVDSLRSANHEFMNKLHVILGLLEIGETQQAKQYILNTSLASTRAISDIHKRVPIPSLAGLLIGKMLRARDLGITFLLKQDSYFYPKQTPLPSDCLITLVGNLVENAMDELNRPDCPVKQIELGVYSEEGHTTIVCDDTGGGIPEEILFSIYDPHTTTKGEGHGNGYNIMKEIVDHYEGAFHIDTEPGEGSSIEIILPV